MVKGFGMLPNKFLQGKRLCTYKDTACRCKALCKSTRLSVKVYCVTPRRRAGCTFSVCSRVCSSSNLPDTVGGMALLCRGRVALLKVPGQTVQIHKPAAPSIHIPDFSGLAKPPDIGR